MRKTPVQGGTRWGRLVVVRKLPGKNEHGHVRWECRCDCGRKVRVWGYALVKKQNPTRSCGMGECWHIVRATAGAMPDDLDAVEQDKSPS